VHARYQVSTQDSCNLNLKRNSREFLAIALVCNAKKGLSAKQMERDLGVSYRTGGISVTASARRFVEGTLPMLKGTVEVDETYIGGRYDKRRKRGPYE
jgi:hypothetical protein